MVAMATMPTGWLGGWVAKEALPSVISVLGAEVAIVTNAGRGRRTTGD